MANEKEVIGRIIGILNLMLKYYYLTKALNLMTY